MRITPNNQETEVILELAKWCADMPKDNQYLEYLTKRIQSDIESCWEDLTSRYKTIGHYPFDVAKIKNSLVKKYKVEGLLVHVLSNRVQFLRNQLNAQVYEYFLLEAKDLFIFSFNWGK